MFLDFRDIPGNQNLFLDYLNEFDNVKEFYDSNFRNKELYNEKFQAVAAQAKFREELPSILRKQYQNLEPSNETIKNIEKLNAPSTLAVVTGQQLGIFGGPLYTIYKTITAIKLSAKLAADYKNFQFVPVFWLEADDHDFEEIRSVKLISESNEPVKISYDFEIKDDENPGSVGNIKITSAINNFFEQFRSTLKDTEFTPLIIEKLSSFYKEGKTFSTAFKELLFWLFDKYGLIIFDPQDKRVKQLLIPVFKKEISDFRQHSETLVKVSAGLEELYHAQVKIRAINLFHNYDEGRYLIEPVDNEYRLKRKRKRFTFDELNDLIEKEPESFSPNVLLRPVCQDYLLPDAAYIGGPGEIAYFSQVMPLYEYYDITPPVIYPRASITLLEKSVSTILEKFNLDIKDIFKDREELKKNFLSEVSSLNVDEIFSKLLKNLDMLLNDLKVKLNELDKTLGDSSDKYNEKIIRQLEELKKKAADAHAKKYETTLRQLNKAIVNIYPDSSPQEREINLFYYMNKYGPGIIEKLLSEIETEKFRHQIIML